MMNTIVIITIISIIAAIIYTMWRNCIFFRSCITARVASSAPGGLSAQEVNNLAAMDIAQKKAGEQCTKDSECDLYLWCNTEGVCTAKSKSGQACNVDNACGLGLFCDPVTHKCIDQNKFGYSCTADDQCLSPMKCLEGQCGYLYY